MKFDLPSFLLGCGACAGAVLLGRRLSPLLLEVATVLYRGVSAVAARAAKQEEFENLLAEARVRVSDLPERTHG